MNHDSWDSHTAAGGQPAAEPHQASGLHRTVFDVGVQRVAKVYAEALLDAAALRQQQTEVLEELEALVQNVFQIDPQFETFLASGAMSRHRKAEIIRSIFETRGSQTLVNFLLVLNEHDRLDLLRTIVGLAREIHDQRLGRLPVQVYTAVPLPDDQRERLLQQLRESLQREPVLDVRTDPELLGGLVVRVGDWVYDASVRTRLGKIRDELIERSSYEIQSGRDRFCSQNGD